MTRTPAISFAVSIGISVTILLIVAPLRSAQADLYTDGVLSLEWIVDSCDGIYRVEYRLPDEGPDPWAIPVDTIKPLSGLLGMPDPFRNTPRHLNVALGQEWLFFLRRDDASKYHVFHRINLSNPKNDYRTAAVLSNGSAILERDAILKAVNERLLQRQVVPAQCDRTLTDRLLDDDGKSIWKGAFSPETFPTPSPFNQYLGAMVVKIDCNTWDQHPGSLDTWLVKALAPVRLQDRSKFLEAKTTSSICLLVNFPGKETEDALKRVLAEPHDASYRNSARRAAAGKLLDTMRLLSNTDEQFFQRLLGTWRVLGRHEVIDLELTKDGYFTAVGYDRDQDGPGRKRWSGIGRWLLRDDEFSLLRLKVRLGKGHLRNGRRDIFRDKKVLSATTSEIELDGGPKMVQLAREDFHRGDQQ